MNSDFQYENLKERATSEERNNIKAEKCNVFCECDVM
jgi:hypothetical protein